jgi:hypothetical protein
VTPGHTGTGQAFTTLIHRALRAYGRDDELARVARLTELPSLQARLRTQPAPEVGPALRAVLDAGLARLGEVAPQAADLLRRRFVQAATVAEVALALNYAERTVYLRQEEALTGLAQIIWDMDAAAQTRPVLNDVQQAALVALPPPSYSRLFGVSELLARLKKFLRADQACWLVSLEGTGGIGKTALAHAVVEALVREGSFQRALWVTARQQFFA